MSPTATHSQCEQHAEVSEWPMEFQASLSSLYAHYAVGPQKHACAAGYISFESRTAPHGRGRDERERWGMTNTHSGYGASYLLQLLHPSCLPLGQPLDVPLLDGLLHHLVHHHVLDRHLLQEQKETRQRNRASHCLITRFSKCIYTPPPEEKKKTRLLMMICTRH